MRLVLLFFDLLEECIQPKPEKQNEHNGNHAAKQTQESKQGGFEAVYEGDDAEPDHEQQDEGAYNEPEVGGGSILAQVARAPVICFVIIVHFLLDLAIPAPERRRPRLARSAGCDRPYLI
ncbi:hypothetical protein SDC9_82872 [bioreactor metagenome]|uniref:Uncharacterized protein n=1 Tax=bioreactor metagenome TaxID=1076179 RepID=A0A644Z6M8_9ZZZZ